MSRPELKINVLKRTYLECNNVEKENIIDDALNKIKALTIVPSEVKNE